MFELKILNKDASTYWVQHFDQRVYAEKWLKEEKTRPYWKKDYTFTITKKADVKISQEKLDEITAKANEHRNNKALLKASFIDLDKMNSIAKLRVLVRLLVNHVLKE